MPAVFVTTLGIEFREFLGDMVIDGVCTEGRRELETLEWSKIHGERSLELEPVRPVIFLVDGHHRVMTDKTVLAHCPVISAVGIDPGLEALGVGGSRAIRCVPRLFLAGSSQDLERAVLLLDHVVAGECSGKIEVHLEPVRKFLVHFGTEGVFSEVRLVEISLLSLGAE